MLRFMTTIAAALVLAGPVGSQETTTADDVRAVVADMRDWPPDYGEMDSRLAKAYRKGKKRTLRFFEDAGKLERVTFWETFGGADLYLLDFENCRAAMQFARDADGKIWALRVRGIGWR